MEARAYRKIVLRKILVLHNPRQLSKFGSILILSWKFALYDRINIIHASSEFAAIKNEVQTQLLHFRCNFTSLSPRICITCYIIDLFHKVLSCEINLISTFLHITNMSHSKLFYAESGKCLFVAVIWRRYWKLCVTNSYNCTI